MSGEAPVKTVRKLIEVALPLDAINRAAAHEKMPGIGPHPRGLHQWWSRKPLAAARAVLFGQLVDDPSSRPDLFRTKERQDRERDRLFAILRDLVKWENTTNEAILEVAREEIRKSWGRTCADNADHPRASELFDPERLPAFHDPFAGGGAIPLEAQRLGLEAHASDLNPVAVLINKAMIEIPPKFAGRPPVNPESRQRALGAKPWKGAAGLAEDVRYYGQWMRDEAERRIGHLYPKVLVTEEMAAGRPDLERYAGRELTVIAWLWARTVHSPNPAFAEVEVPLVSNFMLSTKKGKEAWVEPIVEGRNYRFEVRVGPPGDRASVVSGTKLGRGSDFRCLVSDVVVSGAHIKAEGQSVGLGSRLMAIVAAGDRERVYLSPIPEHEDVAQRAEPEWRPDGELVGKCRDQLPHYGVNSFSQIFSDRQLTALTTLSDLVSEARTKAHQDAIAVEKTGGVDIRPLREGGVGPDAYADALAVYLAFVLDRCADYGNSCALWARTNEKTMHVFGRQAIAMAWEFPEAAILEDAVGGFGPASVFVSDCMRNLSRSASAIGSSRAEQGDARSANYRLAPVVSTDPPYYDNIGYADLSDFFYVWLCRSIRQVFPNLFATLAVPKMEELVATRYRHRNSDEADAFFLENMKQVMSSMAKGIHPAFPATIYYAFRQSETKKDVGVISTGWSTFLDSVVRSGFRITGTLPLRTEQAYRMVAAGTNALASSIVLVCRRRPEDARPASWGELRKTLQSELPPAVVELQKAGIAPVDLAQAAIGPGMAVFTRYSGVFDQDGEQITVGQALALINDILDRTLAEQEGDFDPDTRWALAWFTEYHFDEGDYGIAETLSKAKNTSVEGLVEAGILQSREGRVRLLRPEELPADWDPWTDRRLTVWEMVHHLVRVLEGPGEIAAGRLLRRIGGGGETARALAHSLYGICDRQKRPAEARPYNALVLSWPELRKLAQEDAGRQQSLL